MGGLFVRPFVASDGLYRFPSAEASAAFLFDLLCAIRGESTFLTLTLTLTLTL